ncbi:NitT/TauT family transport system substrate-binding protein [Burkholderia sp. D7]|nr:NitT/TauT family transport system substrate-binding protein [Burkholderia sp. D7]
MNWTVLKRLLTCLFSVIFLLTGSGGAHAGEPVPIKIRLDWGPWGSHAAFYLAQQKGWYKRAGLDVEIVDGTGSVSTVQILGSSGQFDLGYAATSAIMIGKEKGLPVKIVAEFFRRNDEGLIVAEDAKIKKVSDLRGKTVAYTAGAMEAPFVDTFLKAGGLTRADVTLVSVDAASKLNMYAFARADAAFASVPALMPLVANKRASRPLLFSDNGLPMPSFCVFGSEDAMDKKRDAIAQFVSITSGAWNYIARGHAAEAADAMIAQRPQARLDKAYLTASIAELIPYRGAPASSTQPLGTPIDADFADAIKTLSSVGLLKSDHPPSQFYAEGFVRPTVVKAIGDQ